MTKHFSIGDKVSVIDDDIDGKIVKIISNTIHVETIDGFVLTFIPSDLIKIENNNKLESYQAMVNQKSLKEDEPVKRKNVNSKKREKIIPPMEVDLHINQLVNSTKGMDNYDILSLQLDTAKRQIEFAVQKRIQKIVFIHGVGEGVLRSELETLLSRYDNLKYYDADYQKYGVGATEVYLFQNPK